MWVQLPRWLPTCGGEASSLKGCITVKARDGWLTISSGVAEYPSKDFLSADTVSGEKISSHARFFVQNRVVNWNQINQLKFFCDCFFELPHAFFPGSLGPLEFLGESTAPQLDQWEPGTIRAWWSFDFWLAHPGVAQCYS